MQTRLKFAAVGLLGALALSGCSGNAQAGDASSVASDMCTGGFEGWWNMTPADGNIEGLPLAGVTVHSETGRIVDAFHRVEDGSAESIPVEEVDYDVVVDSSWPKNNLVEIETATGKVLAMNEIPEQAPNCEPLAGSSASVFEPESIILMEVETGRTISETKVAPGAHVSVGF